MVIMKLKKSLLISLAVVIVGLSNVLIPGMVSAAPTEGTHDASKADKPQNKQGQGTGQRSADQNQANQKEQQSKKSAGNNGCGTDTSIIRCDPNSDENPIINLLQQAVKILYGVIGVLAVVVIMIAGVIYGTAGDQEDRIRTAKTMIRNTIIGILLYVFMTVILNFLVPGGVF